MGSHEKMDGGQHADSIKSREIIIEAGPIDLVYFGMCFTWCNNHMGTARIWKRIDQALATTNWLQCFLGY